MNEVPVLTWLVGLPLLGAAVVGWAPAAWARRIGLGIAMAVLGGVAALVAGFDPGAGGMQFEERVTWIAALGIDYCVGVDGLGVLMVLLVALLVPMALVVARENEAGKAFVAMVLLLQATLFGAFTALNYFLWFLYYELSLVPAFLLVRMGRETGNARVSVGGAAYRFFVVTLAGSVGMLLGMLAIQQATGTLDAELLAGLGREGGVAEALGRRFGGESVAGWVFFGILVALAVKIPVVPLHTWLPDAYAAAPTSATMLLTGAMSKLGVFGLIRWLAPLFPEEMVRWGPVLMVWAAVSVVASALAALAQRDLKRLLGYASVNHLGYCVLGVIVGWTGRSMDRGVALDGVLLQMFNHGLGAAGLFALVGWLEGRTGRRGIDGFGGVRAVAPVYAGVASVAWFASLGLPGLNGFPGELLIFKGLFGAAPWVASFAALGLLVTAVFSLKVLQRVFHGPVPERCAGLRDFSGAGRCAAVGYAAVLVLLGVWPQLLVGLFDVTVRGWLP